MRPYRASCTDEACEWDDKVMLRIDDVKSRAADHHEETGHITVVTDFERDEVLYRYD